MSHVFGDWEGQSAAVESELLSKALLWALCSVQEVFVHFHPLMQNNLILTGEMLIQ